MLAFFGLLLFALLGVSALVLDFGVAGLAQSRLEVTAESVALESARGASEAVVRARAEDLLFDDSERREARLRLGPIGPLDTGDAGCAGALPDGGDGNAVFAQRVPLLFGHGSMIAFASTTSWGEILEARVDGPTPTPVLPDSEIPAGVRGLREQGVCVEGRGSATLVPALAVAGVGQRTLPLPPGEPPRGLSLLDTSANALWQSRALTRETACGADEQGGAWFELVTESTEECEPTDHSCTLEITGEASRIGPTLGGTQAELQAAPEPVEDIAEHRTVVAPLRSELSGEVIGFATLCARRVGTSVFVAMLWSDTATPFTAFTAELYDTTRRGIWEDEVQELYERESCRDDSDPNLRCIAQSAVLSLPGPGA